MSAQASISVMPCSATPEPQPGCSHWSELRPTVPSSNKGSNPRAASPRVPRPEGLSSPQQGVTSSSSLPVNWETKYNDLFNTHIALLASLQNAVECPICMEVPRVAPVPCCRNGHVFCSPCLQLGNIDKCPTCKVSMSQNPLVRCVSNVANSLLDLIPHPCKFKDSGCTYESQTAGMMKHEKDCEYRDIKCPSFSCKTSISLKALGNHIMSIGTHDTMVHVHSVPNSFTRHLVHDQKPVSFEPIRFKFDGRIFYLQSVGSTDKKFLYNFVQMEGSIPECCTYKAHISLVGEGSSVEDIKHSVPITPIDLHCVEDFGEIGYMMIITDMVLSDYISVEADSHQPFFKLEVKMTRLDKTESDKLLAKVEKQQELNESASTSADVRQQSDEEQLRRVVSMHVDRTDSIVYNTTVGINADFRKKILEHVIKSRKLKEVTRESNVLKDEAEAYRTARSKVQYIQRMKSNINKINEVRGLFANMDRELENSEPVNIPGSFRRRIGVFQQAGNTPPIIPRRNTPPTMPRINTPPLIPQAQFDERGRLIRNSPRRQESIRDALRRTAAARLDVLDVERRPNDGARNYECTLCDRRMESAHSLSMHMRLQHQNSSNERPPFVQTRRGRAWREPDEERRRDMPDTFAFL